MPFFISDRIARWLASSVFRSKSIFPVADLSGGNDSNPAFLCNGACQTAKADTNAHSTLDQGKSRKFITDFKTSS